jgi:putative transposase
VIRLTVVLCIRYPLSLRQFEDLLFERGSVRLWWNRFGSMFAAEIRWGRAGNLRAVPQWRWHLDEVFVKINGEMQTPGSQGCPGVPEACDEALQQPPNPRIR